MNSKISIGQYIPTNSWLHRLDPRFKIISLILLLTALFLVPISASYTGLIVISSLLLISLILTISAKVPIKRVISGIRPLVFLLTFTFVLQLFFFTSGNPLLENPITLHISITSIIGIILVFIIYNFTKKYIPFRILYFFVAVFLFFLVQYLLPYGKITTYQFNPTNEGLIRGIFLFIRIIATITFTSLLTFTTMTTDLNFGLEFILKPLKLIFVPVELFAMMVSLVLRFIPTLLFETEKIMKAQSSRGLDFKESKLKEKITQVIALLVPILLISVTRAEELADAMDARGYIIGEKRTRIDEYKLNFVDYLSLFLSLVILATIIYLRVTKIK